MSRANCRLDGGVRGGRGAGGRTAELQRRLTQRALELDEPYRGALLLRYFEGLSPREIAA